MDCLKYQDFKGKGDWLEDGDDFTNTEDIYSEDYNEDKKKDKKKPKEPTPEGTR